MKFKNDATGYGFVAKFFHWVIAFLILGLLPVGLFMTGMANSPAKLDVYALHKSFGLLVFFLGLARIVWRIVSPPPPSLPNHQSWERALAHASHVWLYVCVIGMPLSGWLMSSAGQFPIPFFGIQMPALIGKNEQIAGLFYQVHEILAYTLLAVLALHIAGALKHHVIDRDTTLDRMAFLKGRVTMPAVVIIVSGLSNSVCAMILFQDFMRQKTSVTVQEEKETPEETKVLAENGWAIVKSQSKLSFETTLYGSALTGDFTDFTGEIVFDPKDLSSARADIRIGLKSVTTGDESRDQTLQEEPWFDAANFPDARFESSNFEQNAENAYTANGTLTLRNVSLPVTLPFTLSIEGETAKMKASLNLNRLDFGVGKGEWEDEATVGHAVRVEISLTATR